MPLACAVAADGHAVVCADIQPVDETVAQIEAAGGTALGLTLDVSKAADWDAAMAAITERFGGVTAHHRAPAEGLWKESGDSTVRDEIVIYEVMTDGLDRTWWAAFQERLRERFRQDELVVRALPIERL